MQRLPQHLTVQEDQGQSAQHVMKPLMHLIQELIAGVRITQVALAVMAVKPASFVRSGRRKVPMRIRTHQPKRELKELEITTIVGIQMVTAQFGVTQLLDPGVGQSVSRSHNRRALPQPMQTAALRFSM
jgi:hypothetical protein